MNIEAVAERVEKHVADTAAAAAATGDAITNATLALAGVIAGAMDEPLGSYHLRQAGNFVANARAAFRVDVLEAKAEHLEQARAAGAAFGDEAAAMLLEDPTTIEMIRAHYARYKADEDRRHSEKLKSDPAFGRRPPVQDSAALLGPEINRQLEMNRHTVGRDYPASKRKR